MSARRVLAVAALIGAAACSPPANAPEQSPAAETAPALNSEGYGPVRVGMTVDEASAALGVVLKPGDEADDPQACDIAAPEDAVVLPGLHFLTEGGRIGRASIYAPSADGHEPVSEIKTDKGVGLGSTDAEVRAAYPNAVEQPAKYNAPPAHDLIVWTRPNERGVRFEVDEQGKVWAIHAGGPTILYVEGCS
jgi:hypothetical protein